MHTFISKYIATTAHIYIYACMHTYIHTRISTAISAHTYLPTYIHTYFHSCKCIYIHTYTRTYITRVLTDPQEPIAEGDTNLRSLDEREKSTPQLWGACSDWEADKVSQFQRSVCMCICMYVCMYVRVCVCSGISRVRFLAWKAAKASRFQ